MERKSIKRNFKEEDEEPEKMDFDMYCIMCQTYGHIPSKECVVRAVCLNCGFKGHVRRYCNERKRQVKNIKLEEIKRENIKMEDIKRECIKMEELKEGSSNYENEYVEAEVPKDEPQNDALELKSDSDITEIGRDVIKDRENSYYKHEYLEVEIPKDEPKNYAKKIKVEMYCNLCQIHGHILSEACVFNAICFVCGTKGHVRRDCKEEKCEFKYEEEYIEEEIKKDVTKTEVESKYKSELTEDKDMISLTTGEENNQSECLMNLTDIGENCEWNGTQSFKRCSVNLHNYKVTSNQYKKASRKSNGQERHEDISCASQKYSYLSERKTNFTRPLKKCTVNLPKVTKKGNEDDSSESNRQVLREGVLYSCKKCSYETKYKGNLRRHLQAEHEGVIFYCCKKCNYETKYKGNLTQHIKAKHEGVRYHCKKCSYEAKYKEDLPKHIQAEHEGVIYSCKKCSYEAKYKSVLKRHIRAKHEGITYSCKKCSYEAKYKEDLPKHIQAEHEGVIYSCKKCSYETKYKSALKRHIRAKHEGITYSCKKCSYEAIYKSALKNHIQAEHEGVIFPCKKCSFEANRRDKLKRHIQAQHEGVIYSCKKCRFEAKYKGILKKHMQSVH